MSGTFRSDDCEHLLLPGLPADYLDTTILSEEHRVLLSEREVMLQVLRDQTPLPTTDAREGSFGPRHLEYWLSGLRDMRKIIAATGLDRLDAPRILDFGGASGRVIRHFRTWRPAAQLFVADINPAHVSLTKRMFGGEVTALRNSGLPTLPFPDTYFDCVMVLSVLTHVDSEDTAWLLELRRVIRPGGHLYVTIHDQATWEILPNSPVAAVSFGNPDFRRYHAETPRLSGRMVHTYSDAAVYQCNVFHGRDYIDRYWAPLFRGYDIVSLAHDHQAGLTFTV